MDEARAAVLRLSESDELALSFAPGLGWHPVRHLLGITAFGMNLEEALQRWPDDPILLYNLACFESLGGRGGEALTHLRRAVELEPKYVGYAADDADLDALRGEPGFPLPPG